MLTEHLAIASYDSAGLQGRMTCFEPLLEEIPVVARGHETDFLGLRLVGRDQAERSSLFPHLLLRQVSKWEMEKR